MCFGPGKKKVSVEKLVVEPKPANARKKPKKVDPPKPDYHKNCGLPVDSQISTTSVKNASRTNAATVHIHTPKDSATKTTKDSTTKLTASKGSVNKIPSKTASIRTANSYLPSQNDCGCAQFGMDEAMKSSNTCSSTTTKREYNIKVVPTVDLVKFSKDFLIAHNAFRDCHGCKSLSLKSDCTKHAQKWADECAIKDRMAHNPDELYGENVYSCSGFEPTGFHVSNAWYKESEKFNYDKPAFSANTGHFTNMIWKDTSKVGVGVARSVAGKYYVVACYNTPGNVKDQFAENVPPRRPNVQLPVEQMNQQKSSGLFGYRYNDFQRECLDTHNELREKHNAQELTLDASLCHSAQYWAEQCAAANEASYTSKAPYGQNVHVLKADQANKGMADGGRAVRSWYGEIQKYNGSLNPGIVHFTQVVWSSSRELGVGVAKSRTGDVYTVAHYFPPGNITGQNEQNVLNWKKSKGK